jgi:hypothetical protein
MLERRAGSISGSNAPDGDPHPIEKFDTMARRRRGWSRSPAVPKSLAAEPSFFTYGIGHQG